VSSIVLPHSLVILACSLAVAFCIAVLIAAQKKRREPHFRYEPVMSHSMPPNGGMGQHRTNGEPHLSYVAAQEAARQRFEASYQDMGGYQIPSKHKDITYCVIDERLVDT